MEVKEVLFMNKGEEDSSYFHNSAFTQNLAAKCKPVLEKAIQSLFTENEHDHLLPSLEVLNVADLGSAATPTTISVMETIIDTVKNTCQELDCEIPELNFCLNDLPGNDFNTLFKGLCSFVGEKHKNVSCFVMGAPGSFHGRLFPRNSLHLVHSCYSVHWLSKVPRLWDEEGLPLNRGKIYISKTSPPAVREAYLTQFQQDFSSILMSRSQEMVPGGRVVLILHGRQSTDFTGNESCYNWEVLAKAIADMVSMGLIGEEELDSFNVPHYSPSLEEVKEVVDKEGSFAIELLETYATEVGDKNIWNGGAKDFSQALRSLTEPMISHHFGIEIIDKLYDKVTDILVQDFATQIEPIKDTSLIVVLKRKK
ncbi:hypothetical protein Dsin_002552 [Dipteronia sinensis]|uniref:Uncharacterized protein n=1 Tax=Dipteronia sinensis TaxID=43782 RepID=A0AAE0B6E7_9ROSI|nr:hypothetical protein Dsin_002552 [Dipteronia sinensis]